MKAVPSLATEAFRGIDELVEYYSFFTWYLFMANAPLRPFENTGGKIAIVPQNSTLMRPLCDPQPLGQGQATTKRPDPSDTITRILHHMQELQTQPPSRGCIADQLADIVPQVVIAAENLLAIAWYLNSIRTVFVESLPESAIGSLGRLYTDTVPVFLLNFTKFTFPYLVPGLVQLNEFDSQVRAVKWTLGDALTEPHGYTNTWLVAAREFASLVNGLPIEQPRKDELWVAMWLYTNFVLLNALASTTKCTGQGRTAMVSDFRSISHEFTQLTSKRIQVDQSWVADYIHAFFKDTNDFKAWIEGDHRGARRYTAAHILSLIETGLNCDLNRQARKDLRTFVQNLPRD
jgi:hypothetical protein